MPYVNGIYEPADQRSPMERLYGYEELMAKRKALQQQQAMQQQRAQILKESYKPGEEARTEYDFDQPQAPQAGSFAQAAPDIMSALGIADAPQMQTRQIEATPGSFDAQSAIARLYGGNDLEGASALVNDQYKDSMASRTVGGGEKWSKTGRIIRGEDGRMYSQVQSDAGNSKLVPVDGELVGQNQVIRAGGKTYIKDAYTNETREVIDSTMTPGEIAENDPELQARLSGAKAEGGAVGKGKGEREATAELSAEKGIPVIEKTLQIVGELENHPGREAGTGFSSWRSAVPGTEAHDFGVKLEQLAGQTFLSEVEKMRGLGTLTETEGKKLSAAAASLKASQTEQEFLRQLRIFRDELGSARSRHQARLDARSQRPGSAPAARAPSAMPSLPNPAQNKGRTVRDTKSGVRYQSNGSQWMRVK